MLPAQWPQLREAGQYEAAELLTAEVLTGRMNDVDCARVGHAWETARKEAQVAAFSDTVLRKGAAAWVHPSGARDLPGRAARHDLLDGQVRIGQWTSGDRTPSAYRGAGTALGPETLGTSLLVVGPSGSGKTKHVVAPVVESLALRALTGQCAVVAVCAAGTPLGPDSAYDVVVRIGDPASVYDLDPYADTADPDAAAAFLAEGLVGDLDTVGAQRATTALAQLLGPYRAVHGTFPSLPVLRELLEGEPRRSTPCARRWRRRSTPGCAATSTPGPGRAAVPPIRARCSPTGSRCLTGPCSPTSSAPATRPSGRSRCAPSPTTHCGSASTYRPTGTRRRPG